MKKIWKWRWITFTILSIIDVIGVIIVYFFVQDLIIFIVSAIAIQGIMPLLYKLILVQKLKEIEEEGEKKEIKKNKIVKKDPIKIVLCSLYRSYRRSPSALIMGEGMLDAINSRLGESDVLTKTDLVFALDYLENKGAIRQSKVLESDIPFDIRILPNIVDLARDC